MAVRDVVHPNKPPPAPYSHMNDGVKPGRLGNDVFLSDLRKDWRKHISARDTVT